MFKIRRCIDDTAAKAMVHTMVNSKLDYCSIFLYGLAYDAGYISEVFCRFEI